MMGQEFWSLSFGRPRCARVGCVVGEEKGVGKEKLGRVDVMDYADLDIVQ